MNLARGIVHSQLFSQELQRLGCSTLLKCIHSVATRVLPSVYLTASDEATESILAKDMLVYPDFLSEAEEKSLLDEVEPYMKRLRYEFDHWDNAIHGYRETEKLKWNKENEQILQRVRELAFPPDVSQIASVHVLDVSKEGYIKPHVDAVRFCGNTIAGLCLLSSCVMRLVNEKDPNLYGDFLLNQRSLYIMRHQARYEYTHEVLPGKLSMFKGKEVQRDRRISVICRNEPDPTPTHEEVKKTK